MSGDRWLQDYLDDRLSGKAKAEAEARIREDPELGRRVASGREIREALAGEDPELSSAFYRRARARFEGPHRSGVRFLRWEAVGLAAAAVLALVLFVPQVGRETREEVFAPAPAPTPTPTVADRAEEPPAEEELRDAGELVEQKPALSSGPVPAPAPVQKRARAKDERQAGAAAGRVDSDEHRPYAPEPMGRRADADDEHRRAGVAEVNATFAEHEQDKVARERLAPRTRVVELPVGVAAAGSVRIVRDAAGWNALLQGDLVALGPYRNGLRLILVGSFPGAGDCSGVRVVEDTTAYRVTPTPERSSRDSPGGCAFTLPADGKPVFVE